jgi:hypothetical protein
MGRLLDDEIVIIHPSGSTGELEIFQPYSGVRLPGVLGDIGGRLEVERILMMPKWVVNRHI